MKRLLIALSVLLSYGVNAQVKNYITLSAELGEASYLYNIENISSKISGGAGGGIQAGYEMRSGAFILNAGLGVVANHSILNVGQISETLFNMTDDDPVQGGDMFDYIYNQTSRYDSYTNLSVQVPVMLGVASKHFYCLAGAKLDVSVLARAKAKATISSQMIYHDYPSQTPMMPNHGAFQDYEVTQKPVKVDFKPQVLISAEIGYRFVTIAKGTGYGVPKEENNYWRLGLFADYGLLDIHKKIGNDNITFPQTYSAENMQNITINNIFSTKQAMNSKVNNLMIGIKATYLFRMPEKRSCVICRDAYRSRSAGPGNR